MKKYFLSKCSGVFGVTLLLVLTMTALSFCQMQTDPTVEPEIFVTEPEPDDTLVGTSWIKGDETLEFNSPAPDGLAVLGNVDHTYTYDNAVKAGNVSAVGDFTLSADGKTLSFAVCAVYPDGASFTLQEEDPNPDPPEETVVATKWLWNGVVLEFTTAKKAKLGGVTYTYTYNSVTKTGTIPDVGGFSITEDPTSHAHTLSFAKYKTYDYGADFKKEELPATKWKWAAMGTIYEFTSDTTVTNGIETYTYTYNEKTRTGIVQTLGEFTVTAEYKTMSFPNFNPAANPGGPVAITLERYRDPAEPGGGDTAMESLVGTRWRWNSGGYGVRTLYFETADTVQFQDQNTPTEPWYPYHYTYSKTTKKGQIDIFGKFTVSADNKRISFVQWKSYPHGAEYDRLED